MRFPLTAQEQDTDCTGGCRPVLTSCSSRGRSVHGSQGRFSRRLFPVLDNLVLQQLGVTEAVPPLKVPIAISLDDSDPPVTSELSHRRSKLLLTVRRRS